MSRYIQAPLVLVLIALAALPGCHPLQPFYFHDDGDLSHFVDKTTEVEHPDLDQARLSEVDNALAPLTLSNPEFQEIWDLSLEECISIALHNSKVIRNAASIQANFGFSDALIGRTAQLNTVYDSAITESNTSGAFRSVNTSTGAIPVGSGGEFSWQRNQAIGVQDALSEFDTQFYSSLSYNKTDRPNNTTGNFFQPIDFQANESNFLASLSKKTAPGAVFTFRNRTNFDWNNVAAPGPGRAVPGAWQTQLETEAVFPILRGRGTMINRIPVVLARINSDISLADFEASVRNLMMDLENAYWDLDYFYRNLEAAKVGRDSAQATWKIVFEKWQQGVEPSQAEAQARGQYFQLRAAAESALRELYTTETKLRWLMGIAATDGRLIRPKDEPSLAHVEYDWHAIHAESLFRSAELRQQKWRIKQRELELITAKNTLLPVMNATALYRWLGRGDELINADRNGLNFPAPGSTAVDNLTEGDYQEAFFQLDFQPARFGARRELASVRNAQLQLARSKAQLEEMELNQSHLLTIAVRDVDGNYTLAQSHFNRWAATEKEVDSVEALYRGGKATLDLVLDAQRRRAQAQVDYYRALTDYNKSLAFVHYRKGSLLEHNNVQLAEGPWPAKAYWDAVGHARERDASYYLNYGWSRPRVVSRGPAEQIMGEKVESAEGPFEAVPAPTPTPAERPQEDQMEAPPEGPITSAEPRELPNRSRQAAAKPAVSQAANDLDIVADKVSASSTTTAQPANRLRKAQVEPQGTGLR